MAARKILLLNGPNLDMLGIREPEVYGRDTLESLENTVRMYADQHDVALTCFQSNSEAKLVGRIHGALGEYDGIVYNPGAHTHYSYALRDAVAAIDVPVVEVHLSNVSKREEFRRKSVIAPACVAVVKGLGVGGYCRALDILIENDGLPRLGEGYETHFDQRKNIFIAGQEDFRPEDSLQQSAVSSNANEPQMESGRSTQAAAVSRALSQQGEGPLSATPLSANAPTALPAEREGQAQARDLTVPFHAQIRAVDLGMLSFERQNLARATCDRLGIEALLVRDTPNIRWLTAFDDVFDEERAHALLVSRERCVLHTDSRYANAVRTAAAKINSDIIIDDSAPGKHAEFALKTLTPGEHGSFEGRLGIEDSITYDEFTKVVEAFGAQGLAPTTNVVRSLRAVKGAAELARMRAAQAITDAAFEHIVGFMRPGMTEREVQLELEFFMLRHGADGLAFSSIVACGENGADPHAIPGGKRLEAGQCVVMDFGARAYGYCSDMTRVVFLGEPDTKMARAWSVLRRANETVEQMLRPGVTGKEAHEAAERVLADGGFAGKMGHGLGHGVGLECHELPVLNARSEAVLAEGNVVTVEPGIYLPGEFGMRLEDCGVITADGYEVFSKLGHNIVII